MNLLIVLLIIISLSLLTTVIIWRISLPKQQTLSIIIIFFGFFVFFLIPIYSFFESFNFDEKFYAEIIQLCIFHFSFLFAFLIAYTAIDKNSPTLFIILKIFNSGKKGLDKSEIHNIISTEEFISPRINDLIESSLVIYKDDKLFITKKGKISLAPIFVSQYLINQKTKSA